MVYACWLFDCLLPSLVQSREWWLVFRRVWFVIVPHVLYYLLIYTYIYILQTRRERERERERVTDTHTHTTQHNTNGIKVRKGG